MVNSTTLSIAFDYEAFAQTDDGQNVKRNGTIQFDREMESDDYLDLDDGMLYSEAMQTAMSDFWTFAVEKAGHRGLSDVTVSISNLVDVNADKD